MERSALANNFQCQCYCFLCSRCIGKCYIHFVRNFSIDWWKNFESQLKYETKLAKFCRVPGFFETQYFFKHRLTPSHSLIPSCDCSYQCLGMTYIISYSIFICFIGNRAKHTWLDHYYYGSDRRRRRGQEGICWTITVKLVPMHVNNSTYKLFTWHTDGICCSCICSECVAVMLLPHSMMTTSAANSTHDRDDGKSEQDRLVGWRTTEWYGNLSTDTALICYNNF